MQKTDTFEQDYVINNLSDATVRREEKKVGSVVVDGVEIDHVRNNKNHDTFRGPVATLLNLIPAEYLLVPFVVNGVENKRFRNVVRDDGYPVGTVGEGYQLFQPKKVISEGLYGLYEATKALDKHIDPFTAQGQLTLSFDKSIVDLSVILPGIGFAGPDGNQLDALYRIRDSVAGGCNLTGIAGILRSICMNRMIRMSKSFEVKYSHSKGVVRGDVVKALQRVVERFPAYRSYFADLDRIKVNTDAILKLTTDTKINDDVERAPLKAVVGKSVNDGIAEIMLNGTFNGSPVPGHELGAHTTAYGLYNAVTFLAQQKSNDGAEDTMVGKAQDVVNAYLAEVRERPIYINA